MKRTLALICLTCLSAGAQAQNSLSSTIEVYVFPTQGQDTAQQQTDEASCFEWSVQNTGSDPFALEKEATAQQQQSQENMQAAQQTGRGSGTRGAVRGAAAGAIIGEIADDDASRGAAFGAALGAVRGRRQGRQAQAQAQQQAAQSAESSAADNAERVENFKKAFSVCLEAKEYLVKY